MKVYTHRTYLGTCKFFSALYWFPEGKDGFTGSANREKFLSDERFSGSQRNIFRRKMLTPAISFRGFSQIHSI